MKASSVDVAYAKFENLYFLGSSSYGSLGIVKDMVVYQVVSETDTLYGYYNVDTKAADYFYASSGFGGGFREYLLLKAAIADVMTPAVASYFANLCSNIRI